MFSLGPLMPSKKKKEASFNIFLKKGIYFVLSSFKPFKRRSNKLRVTKFCVCVLRGEEEKKGATSHRFPITVYLSRSNSSSDSK
jgi:hypothetical protein